MKKSALHLILAWALLSFAMTSVLIGCEKPSDGKDGISGKPGDPGTPGSGGNNGNDGSDAFYLPDDLTFAITATSIGTSTATLQFTALDSLGNPYQFLKQSDVTSGYLVFLMAQMTPPANPGDPSQWQNYKSNPVVAPGVASPTFDKAGTLALIDKTLGKYSYTFSFNPHSVSSPIAVTYNANFTHRVAMQTALPGKELVVGTANIITKSATFDFVPSGHAVDGIVTVTKAMAATTNCNQCHAGVTGHAKYNDVNLCVMCHNPGANLGDSVNYDMNYMVHAIHSFNTKRTAPWRGPLNTGYAGTATDEVGLPQSSGNCRKCHHAETLSNGEIATGADGDNWKNIPNMKSCTACHNGVDFTVAATHKAPGGTINGGVQTSNKNCSVCHYPDMIEAYHSSATIGSPHKPNATVGSWEKGTITYPRMTYEMTRAEIMGSGALEIDFAIKADGVPIELLDSTGTANNKKFFITYSAPSSKPTAAQASADLPYTKYGLPTAPSFVLAFAGDQDGVTASNAVDWNNLGNGSAGGGQPLTVSLLRLGIPYWARPYSTTAVSGNLETSTCGGDPRQTSLTLAGCAGLGAAGSPTVITAENINLGSLTRKIDGSGHVYFTASITSQTVPTFNNNWRSVGMGSTLVKTYNYVYPYPFGAKLRAVGLQGTIKYDTSPGTTATLGTQATLNAESTFIKVTGDTERRTVIDPAKCANCHEELSLHGGNRVYQPICNMCHNAGLVETGKAANGNNPMDSFQLKNLVHSIHGAEKRVTPFMFSTASASSLAYPAAAMTVTGSVYSYPSGKLSATDLATFNAFITTNNNGTTWGDRANAPLGVSQTVITFPGKPQNCLTCHVGATSTTDATYGIEAIPTKALQATIVVDQDTSGGGALGSADAYLYGRYTYSQLPHNSDLTAEPIAASCRGCHDSPLAKVHMEQNGGKVGTARNAVQVGGAEACIVCHGYGRMVDADVQHGVKSAKQGP